MDPIESEILLVSWEQMVASVAVYAIGTAMVAACLGFIPVAAVLKLHR